MAKNVQQQGGSAESEDLVIGLERQLRVDTSNKELRLHDASTPGGHRIPSRDANDGRYQARSDELDGFNFDSLGIGFLARLGPADYRLRTFLVDSNAFTIQNPNGVDGDPILTLKDSILGVRTFVNGVNFLAGLAGNLIGNVTGNLTGNSLGLHTGNVIGDLQGNSEGNHTGGLDARGESIFFDGSQIPLASVNQAELLAYVKLNSYKTGDIKLWFGLAANVEAGWFICDGANGTPDMRNRMAYGAVDDAALGTTGGAATHNHAATVDVGGSHSHVVTVDEHTLTIAQMPAHTHGNGVCDDNVGNIFPYGTKVGPTGGNLNSDPGSYSLQGISESIGGGTAHTHTAATGNTGEHIHTASTNNASSLPPYRALYYIMKG